jgi:hypothetical protein
MPTDAPSQTSLSKWEQAFGEVSELSNQVRLLIRIANHTNQLAVVRDLVALLKSAPGSEMQVAILGKPENGATAVAAQLSVPGWKIRPMVLEAPAYSDFPPQVLAQVKNSAAILVVVNAVAPLFDETAELLSREFTGVRDKLLIVVVANDGSGAAVAELQQQTGVGVCESAGVADAVLHVLFNSQILNSLPELRKRIRAAAQTLRPFARAFADLLDLSQPQYLRRLEFIHRDVASLTDLAGKARTLLETQTQKSLGDARLAIQSLTGTMRQQAESAVQSTPIPRETLASLDARTQFGRSVIGYARAGAYREFDTRMQALAMDLNSARSVLLSGMDQLRVEAQAHLEELVLNLGEGLLPVWLSAAAPAWASTPLDFPLDPGTGFPERALAATRQVRGAIPEPQFASAWASRIEGLFKGEMAIAASANWSPAQLDQPLHAALAQLWKDATERTCGILIGRISMIVEAVNSGVAASRLGSLQLPRDPQNRAKVAEAFRGFTAELDRMIGNEIS